MHFSINDKFSGTLADFERTLLKVEGDAITRRSRLIKFYSICLPRKLAKWIDKEFLSPRLQEVMDEIKHHRTITIRFIPIDDKRPEGIL